MECNLGRIHTSLPLISFQLEKSMKLTHNTFTIAEKGGHIMQTSDFTTLIKSRRSIRNWQDKPVPEQLLIDAIELGTWAPNGGNQQIVR